MWVRNEPPLFEPHPDCIILNQSPDVLPSDEDKLTVLSNIKKTQDIDDKLTEYKAKLNDSFSNLPGSVVEYYIPNLDDFKGQRLGIRLSNGILLELSAHIFDDYTAILKGEIINEP